MGTTRTRSNARVRTRARRLAREEAELAGAMTLVARGHARRVILAGLRYGERLAPPAAALGRTMGLRVSMAADARERHSVVVSRDTP